LFLLGLAYALKHDKHVRVDILYTHFSPRTKAWLQIGTMLLFVIPFSALIIYFSLDFVVQSLAQHEGSPDPGGLCCRYLVKSLVVIAFLQLLLQGVGETIKAWERLRGEAR
ncbi:TRAP transporter small permease subunit, partial [Hydrogenimonas sp.]